MAMTPRSSSKLSGSVSAKKDNIKSPGSKKEKEKIPQNKKPEKGISSPAKRNNNPGIRLIHGRIYDSEHGKTCHQCRQKTRDFTAACKNQRNNKPCPINFCHKCLLNRYGEKTEEVEALQNWACPKCRGICNCSLCMKKRGHQPTGLLIRAAKANGFSSVSEMLQINGPDNCHGEKSVKGINDLSRKRAASETMAMNISPKKRGKENNFDGKINSNLCARPSPTNLVEKKPRKVEVAGFNELPNESINDTADGNVLLRKSNKLREGQKERSCKKDCDSVLKESSPAGGDRKPKKIKAEESNEKRETNIPKKRLMKHPTMNLDEKKLKMLEQDDANKNAIAFVRRSPRKHHISGRTSNIHAKSNTNVDPQEKKLSKEKDSVEGFVESFGKDNEKQEVHDGNKNINAFVKRTSPRKHQISNGTSKESAKSDIYVDAQERKLSKGKVYGQGSIELCRLNKEKQEADSSKFERAAESDCGKNNTESGTQASSGSEDHNKVECTFENKDMNAEIPLPQGFELASVHDIEIPPEDVGKALQFLEFCSVFGKILGVKKGQPEIVLRDLMHGRSSRRGKHSVTVQFLIQLLSVIQKERGQGSSTLSQTRRNSWIHALNECISESGSLSKWLDLDSLDKRADGFEYLDSSKKLMITNFLCDEILGTAKIRNWIDLKTKEHKESIIAAKDKEKSLKQQMQDDIAKAIIPKNGASFSISESEAIISKIRREAATALAERVEAKELLLKKNQSSDVVRTQLIYLGIDGRAYWRLKCLSTKSASDILLQDVGTGDASTSDEKWLAFEDEEKELIEKYINSLRGKRLKARRAALQPSPQNDEDCEQAT